jgi:uncharacterized protein YcfL
MKKVIELLVVLSVVVLLIGCGGNNSGSGNMNLRIVQSDFDEGNRSMASSNKSIMADQISLGDTVEYGLYNELGGLVSLRYTLYVYDQDNNLITINNNDVTWSCSADGILQSTTGTSVLTNRLTISGRYVVTATYNGQTAHATSICYPSFVLYNRDRDKRGYNFTSRKLVSSDGPYDFYMYYTTSNNIKNLVIKSKYGLALIDESSFLNISSNFGNYKFSLEPVSDRATILMNKVLLIKCDDQGYHYAMVKINGIEDNEEEVSFYFEYH